MCLMLTRFSGLGSFIVYLTNRTRSWFCNRGSHSFNSKLDDEDSASGGGGAGGAGLVPPDGFYHHHHHHHDDSHAHHLHYLHLHHARAATAGDEPDRGYIEGNRYVAAQLRSVTGLNHSNSSCSSASTASASAVGDAGAAPLYITAPPEGFGMSAAGLTVHTSNRRGTDVSIQNTNTTVLQKENVLPQKMRGKMIRGRYEMSQDLLDKQMEILERRYGGPRARRAAVVLQRAWRRRQLLRKFSAITAMAKATATANAQHTIRVSVNGHQDIYSTPLPKNNGGSDKSLSLGRPMRSMSLRERHDLDVNMVNHLHSGSPHDMEAMAARVQQSAHQLTMLQEQRGDGDSGVCGCSVNGSVTNISMSSSHNESLHNHQHFNNSGPIYGNMLCSGGKPLSSPGGRQQVQSLRKVPPEVPKRTTSITLGQSDSPSSLRRADCCGTPPVGADARGSLSSVQSSGSDSAGSDRVHYHAAHQLQGQHQGYQNHHRTASGSGLYDSPNDRYAVWKRQNGPTPPPLATPPAPHPAYFSPDTSACCAPAPHAHTHPHPAPQINEAVLKVSETVRKRQYRVGLNLFNKKPERGVGYLIARAFLENSPRGVARFLITRKGLSKQMIGEYLGNLQNPFNMAVLECFVNELDLSGMQVDVALRRYQAHFRLPGEAQKIERLVEAFARRYCVCNSDLVQRLRTNDTIFVLAFAIIMLNTDLHTPNLKPEARMSLEDFVKNLRGIDDCGDIDRDMLAGIYERVKSSEFRPGSDHVTQVLKVQATIVGKKPHLALPHRRLVCYCRLYEIPDIHKKERPGVHQREVFLFNDLLVITKIFSKKKSSVSYTFRQSFPLCGMVVHLFSVPHYPFGIRLSRRVDGRRLSTFNARNEHDRRKFAEDLRESVAEMDEMEALRIESELNRGGKTRPPSSVRNVMENRDSGVADVELDHAVEHLQAVGGVSTLQPPPPPSGHAPPAPSPPYTHYGPHHHHPPPTNVIKRNVLSNSLVDINDPVALAAERLQRRGSVGSLDSGMSVSFAGGAGNGRASAPGANLCHKTVPFAHGPHALQRSPPNQGKHNHFLGGIFPVRRERKLSASGIPDNTSASRSSLGKSTEV